MAVALPLRGLQAWRVYLGLPMLGSVVARYERLWEFADPWSDRSRAVAERLDFVARADELAERDAPTLLVVGGVDDEEGFRRPAEELRAALARRSTERAALVEIPEMGHPLAEEPGLEPAPQTAHAARADAAVVDWFRRHLARTQDR